MINMTNNPADDDGFLICFIRGGIAADATGEFARAGDFSWWRADDESQEQFRARAEREARAAGETRIVFGGLPG